MGTARAFGLAAIPCAACLWACVSIAGEQAHAREPSQAFVDVAVSVLGASMASDDNEYYVKAGRVIGAMRVSGEACVAAGQGDCVVEANGVSIGFGTGRHAVSLRGSSGYSGKDVQVAVEDSDGLRIVDPQAYLYALNTQKVRVVQAYLAMCGRRY